MNTCIKWHCCVQLKQKDNRCVQLKKTHIKAHTGNALLTNQNNISLASRFLSTLRMTSERYTCRGGKCRKT
jgi:hypothetical protein